VYALPRSRSQCLPAPRLRPGSSCLAWPLLSLARPSAIFSCQGWREYFLEDGKRYYYHPNLPVCVCHMRRRIHVCLILLPPQSPGQGLLCSCLGTDVHVYMHNMHVCIVMDTLDGATQSGVRCPKFGLRRCPGLFPPTVPTVYRSLLLLDRSLSGSLLTPLSIHRIHNGCHQSTGPRGA
jgi:hypothetical protein